MIASLSFMILATVNSVLKTPIVINVFKNKKIFQGSTFLFLIGSVISALWSLILFYVDFDPKTILDELKKKARKVKENHIEINDLLDSINFQQTYGRSMFLAMASVSVVLLVMFISVCEFRIAKRTHECNVNRRRRISQEEDLLYHQT